MQTYQDQWLLDDRCVQRGAIGATKVLVVEHSAETQSRFASVLRKAFPNGSVITSASVQASLDVLTTDVIDILVVDLDVSDGSGIDMIQQCVRSSPSTRCVITTTHDDDGHFIEALAAGALGYLLKNQPEAVLIQQLRLLAEGIPPLAPSVAQRLMGYFRKDCAATVASSTQEVERQADLVQLSKRESQVLTLIAKGMEITAVSRLLDITTNTACSHVKNIYRKRNVSSRAEAALEARALGLV